MSDEILENIRRIAEFNERFAGFLDGARFGRSLAELEASEKRLEREVRELKERVRGRHA